MFDKILVLSLVVVCHVYSLCIIGFCLPGVAADEPGIASTIAVVATSLLAIEFLLPMVDIDALPPLIACFYKVFAILLWANTFFKLMWMPLMRALGMSCQNIVNKLQPLPGVKSIMEMTVMRKDLLEMIVALYLLYIAFKTTGAMDWILCKLHMSGEKPPRATGGRQRRSSQTSETHSSPRSRN